MNAHILHGFRRQRFTPEPRSAAFLAVLSAVLLTSATTPAQVTQTPKAPPSASRTNAPPADKSGTQPRTVYRLAEIIEVHHDGNYLEAMKEYNKWMNRPGGGVDKPVPLDVMENMYKAAGGGKTGFKTIASLIQNGIELDEKTAKEHGITHTKIDDAHNVGMAQQRDVMIDAVINDVAKKNGWIIGRSDSGNVKAGIKSDLDQTFYVFDAADPKKLKRVELKDGAFIGAFKTEWKEKHPNLSIETLDIASIEGRNRFPDPREVRVDYLKAFDSTIRDLRATPGAYTTAGAVVQQMQFRALAGILEGNPRMFQLYGPAMDKDGKVILDADGKPKFEKWPFDADTAVNFMFGTHPELMPGHAFGAALANFLELQHYMHAEKFEVKYHLRTYEDALMVQLLAEERADKRSKQEYADMDRGLRNDINDELLNRLFPNDAPKRQLHAMAMDISADFRLLHKNKPEDRPKLSDAVQKLTPEQLKDPKVAEAAIFQELAKKLHKTDTPTPEQIKNAVEQHRKLASEFCLETAYHTSAEAFRLVLQPDANGRHHFDIERYRSMLPSMNEEQWAEFKRQQGQGVLLTFLYGLYDLGWSHGNRLVDRLIRDNPREFLRFMKEKLSNPAEWRALRGPAIILVSDLATKAHSQVAWVLGHEHFEHGKAMNSLFGSGELVDVRNAQGEIIGKRNSGRNLGRGLGRFAQQAALDPGNLDGLVQVWRVAIETRGDMSAIQAMALDQLIFAVPIGGQIYAATQGGIPGAALMGAAMYYPPLGIGLLAVSMADSGYAIYDIEYQKPQLGNMADALYRGFVGPETRSYPGDAPPQFTDAEQRELTQMKAELGRLQGLAEPLRFGQWLLLSDREATAWHRASEVAAQQLKQRQAEFAPRLAILEPKKKAFEEFSDGSWAGGYTYGFGAQLVQKPCTNHLLRFVQPVICFSPSGIVDFKAQFNPATDGPRLAQLEQAVKAAMKNPAADVEQVLTMAEEHANLLLQSNRWARAQAYLDVALGRTTNRPGFTQRENKMPVPELIQRIKRDSMVPEFARAGFVDLPKFVDSFLRTHVNVLNELHSLGLIDRETIAAAAQTGLTPEHFIPASVKKELADRLSADFDRSREMFLKWRDAEKNRVEREKVELRNRINAYHAQEAGASLASLQKDVRYKALFDAIRLANVPRNPPILKSTIRKLPVKQTSGVANAAEEKFTWQLELSITADPDLYHPPYDGELHLLDLNQLRAAVNSGVVGKDNDLLLPQVRDGLRELLNGELGKLKNDEVLVPVVTFFAAGMADLSKANPDTVRHLPGYQGPGQCDPENPPGDGDSPDCADPPGGAAPKRRRVPMGQTVHVGSQTSGAPVIESTSPASGYGKDIGTYVYFRSPLFLKGPGEGADTAKFRLARAPAPGGPWTTVREQSVRLGYDHAPFYPSEGGIARKQSVLHDLWAATNAPARETYDGTKQAWYRVAHVLASGQEVWSEVRGPGPPLISLRAPRWPEAHWLSNETNQLTLSWASGNWYEFENNANAFRLVAIAKLSDQPPRGEGVHVRANWLGRDWHFFTRPRDTNDTAINNRGETGLDLPVPQEPAELVLSTAMFGKEAHRRLRIEPAFPPNVLTQLHGIYTNKFITQQKFQELLVAARDKAAKELSNMVVAMKKDAEYWPREMASATQRGDADRVRDIQKSAPESAARLQRDHTALAHRTDGYGQGFFESRLAEPINAAAQAGRTTEALRLWQFALKLYEAAWNRPMLTDLVYTNAYHNTSSNRVEFTPRPYQRHNTYRAVAGLFWQLGDLDAAHEMMQAEGRLRMEQLRLDNKPQDWPDDLRERAAWNRSYAGKLEAAAAHWDLFENEELRRMLSRTQPPAEAAALKSIIQSRPYWYLAVKNGAKLENYGPAPSAQQLAAANSASNPPRTNAEPSRASAPPPLSLLGLISDPFKYDQPRVTNNSVREGTAVSGGTLPSPGTTARPTPGVLGAPPAGSSAPRLTPAPVSGQPSQSPQTPAASLVLPQAASTSPSPAAAIPTLTPAPAPAPSPAPAPTLPTTSTPQVPATPAPASPTTTSPLLAPAPQPAAIPAPQPATTQPSPPQAVLPTATLPSPRPPGTNHPALTRGYSKMWQGDTRSALADFKAAAEANPADVEARRMRGTLELIAGDPAKARDDADALLREQPGNAQYQLLRGQAALWLNDAETARKHLAEAMRLEPKLPGGLYNQGAQFLQSNAHGMAYLSYLSVTHMDSRASGAYYGMGVAAANLGLKPQAISSFEIYLRADPSASSHAQSARQWLATLQPGR